MPTQMRADGAKLLTLGGDHTLALPNLRSLHKTHGKIAVLHFDAHLDTWDTYFGAPYTHGTPFRRASEEGLHRPRRPAMHIGIRGPLYGKKDLEDDEVLGFQIIRSDEYQFTSVQDVVARMRKRLGDAPVYLSVDIDVLDPAAAPGTGTPEAGGMTSRELLNSIRGLQGLNVVGAEVVEVAPGLRSCRESRAWPPPTSATKMLSLWAAENNGSRRAHGPRPATALGQSDA
jgi:agmatinase